MNTTSPDLIRQVEAESVDTRELIRLLDKYAGEAGPDISACVSRIITARVAAARQEAIEESAEACENLVESIGDSSAYDDREMYDTELERMHTAMDCAKAIRALATSQAAPAKAEGWIKCPRDPAKVCGYCGGLGIPAAPSTLPEKNT